MTDPKVLDTEGLATALASPVNFAIGEVRQAPTVPPVTVPPAPLGPLAAFTGNWIGRGFNTIFRPYGKKEYADGIPDAVLELNLTSETLSFAPSLGSIPNRGLGAQQEDVFLNGVPYLQSINDVTTLPARGIHFEPGIWLYVPATTTPEECVTLARMASIPHGTTINAQGTFKSKTGKPVIACVNINPLFASNGPVPPCHALPNLIAKNQNTYRIPQDLTPFIDAGTITQGMLDDPNTVLREQIANQNISETVTIDISAPPTAPLFGGDSGGLANIAFLLGVNPHGPNAQAVRMKATCSPQCRPIREFLWCRAFWSRFHLSRARRSLRAAPSPCPPPKFSTRRKSSCTSAGLTGHTYLLPAWCRPIP
jgi:hypothetical protein